MHEEARARLEVTCRSGLHPPRTQSHWRNVENVPKLKREDGIQERLENTPHRKWNFPRKMGEENQANSRGAEARAAVSVSLAGLVGSSEALCSVRGSQRKRTELGRRSPAPQTQRDWLLPLDIWATDLPSSVSAMISGHENSSLTPLNLGLQKGLGAQNDQSRLVKQSLTTCAFLELNNVVHAYRGHSSVPADTQSQERTAGLQVTLRSAPAELPTPATTPGMSRTLRAELPELRVSQMCNRAQQPERPHPSGQLVLPA